MTFKNIHTIRYMGTKATLLDFIVPEIISITPKGGTVCDLMAGTNAIGYSLKPYFKIITNDVQEYSHTIAKALVLNQQWTIDSDTAIKQLKENYDYNQCNSIYHFFKECYADTYFSEAQCQEIDSIRYAIAKLENETLQNLYLSALMGAMCVAQSTPGHFAQFMPKDHPRVQSLRAINIWNEFQMHCNDYKSLTFSQYNNECYCADFHNLFANNTLHGIDTLYVDSPYTQEQYSRFYHVLETLVKYDSPKVQFKAKYRSDRFMSKFCYKKTVGNEFESILQYGKEHDTNIVISYSNKGVMPIDKLEALCLKYYPKVECYHKDYKHSTQGKGSMGRLEYLLILTK